MVGEPYKGSSQLIWSIIPGTKKPDGIIGFGAHAIMRPYHSAQEQMIMLQGNQYCLNWADFLVLIPRIAPYCYYQMEARKVACGVLVRL